MCEFRVSGVTLAGEGFVRCVVELAPPDVEAGLADTNRFSGLCDAPSLFSAMYGFPFELFGVDFSFNYVVPSFLGKESPLFRSVQGVGEKQNLTARPLL